MMLAFFLLGEGKNIKETAASGVASNVATVLCHVATLYLQYQYSPVYRPLRGKLSPSLVELKHLTYLDLRYVQFQETRIPKFIGSLSRLQYLNLQTSGFFGTIPNEIGNLTNLRSLYLGGYLSVNNLDWLSNLRSLEVLSLYSIDLEGMEWLQSIGKLPFLSQLVFRSCNLSGIISPSLLSTNLSSIPLTKIDLFWNKLISSSVYTWLFNFSRTLVDIQISGNPLGGSIPHAFGNMMTSLETLYLFNCSLEGEIPKSFTNLSRLQLMDLGVNNITGKLPDITRFSSLKTLWLDKNKLDSFSESFGQPCVLESLSLSKNELNGSFPDLKLFPLLRSLYLSNNKLKGRVPESIGQLSNLKYMSLSFNSLSLEFTSNWTPLFNLNYIGLANCSLGPRFPEWLRSQNIFSYLDISNAGISSLVPYWFWDLSPRLLYYLNISHNHIRGTLPDLSLNYPGYSVIDLHANSFTGPIPLLPPNVSLLNLSKNKFSGSILVVCTAIEFLQFLDLSDNQLSGELPDCWANANSLDILSLSSNNFSGNIPPSFGFLNLLRLMSLSNNHFMGAIPSSLKNCTNLEVIDMSRNNLSGKVPAWIGTHLTSLVVVIFRRNELSGTIPPNFCNLNGTKLLDLSRNKISGTIPTCFNRLYSLVETRNTRSSLSFDSQLEGLKNGVTYNHGKKEQYVAGALVQWKGGVSEYKRTLGLLKCIDLSSNKLVGYIPQELASLKGLISLNLSRNNLTGDIMQNVSQMKMLEVLDLSKNQLSGQIPIGLAALSFLSVLNLSNNNFSGKIPTSTQLQSFDASSYAGNPKLCGPPLLIKCPGEDGSASFPPKDETDEDMLVTTGFYISVVLGFAVGFCGFVGPLFLRTSWRYAYFKFLDKLQDWVLLTISVHMARLRRKFNG